MDDVVNYQTQRLLESVVAFMLVAMFGVMLRPVLLPQERKKLYYAALRHRDPLIAGLLKREGIQVHDYTRAYSREQAERFLKIRYPGYEISHIRAVEVVFPQRFIEVVEPVEYIPIDPLYAAEEWAAMSPEKRIAIEREATLVGERPYIHWLKMSSAYDDWVKLRKYYDEVEEVTRKYKEGEIRYAIYPPFPTLKKPLVAAGPSGYPVRVEECARRYSLEKLRRLARTVGVRVAGDKKDLCWNLMNAGVLLQKERVPAI